MKWSDELKERLCKGENIDKDIFSWVVVLLSIVLKKNDDGDGFIDIWDINKDLEAPIVHTCAFEQSTNAHGYKEQDDGKALGAIKWSRDGRRLAVGDSEGFVSIW